MFDLFKILSGPLAQWLSNRATKKQAEHQRDLAVINNQARLAVNEASHNHAWEMESLKNPDRFLRRFSFFFFLTPIALAIVSPDHSLVIYQRLETVPAWNLELVFVMVSGVCLN